MRRGICLVLFLKEGISISAESLELPRTDTPIIVELAGGLMVPLNDRPQTQLCNIDLLQQWGLPVILVASYYLGSINHTLLSNEALASRGLETAGLVFNGDPVLPSRQAILRFSGLPVLLDLPWTQQLDASFISKQAEKLELP